MPGPRLNDTERHLQGWWDSLTNVQNPYLKKMLIDSSTPIRGISHCDLDIKYPVTIFVGKMDQGKVHYCSWQLWHSTMITSLREKLLKIFL